MEGLIICINGNGKTVNGLYKSDAWDTPAPEEDRLNNVFGNKTPSTRASPITRRAIPK